MHVAGSSSRTHTSVWWNHSGSGARRVPCSQTRPSSSKKIEGSIPATRSPSSSRSHTGSDHGPAGSVAVMTKFPPRVSSSGSTSVHTSQNVPSWWRSVGANRPPDDRMPS
ncbi:Uncharacterised protein [Mycobacteroides abscessus]|nr:Uncharacterised protein [Mycobacteroides abscessus]